MKKMNLFFLLVISLNEIIIFWSFFCILVEETPWFPRRITDLDQCSVKVLLYGADLDADHPVRSREIIFQNFLFS